MPLGVHMATLGGILIANTPPFFTTRSEPVARVTLYVTDKNKKGDLFGIALLTMPSGVHMATLGGMLVANMSPFFTTGSEPVARVTLYLTEKNK